MFIYPIEDGLYLRLLTTKDKETLFQLVDESRDYLRKWLPWVDQTQSAEQYKQIITEWNIAFARNESLTLAIVSEGNMVGIISFHPIDWVNRRVELGYWLAPKYEGNGYMTKACQAMLQIAFEEYDLHRVEIHCIKENERSRAVARRLGMKEEGILKDSIWVYDQPYDRVIYGITRNEWMKKK